MKLYSELLTSHNRVCRPCNSGGKYFLRFMSTMDHPEVSSKQEEISIASIEVQQPQWNKFKRPDKTARHIMNISDKEEVGKVQAEREIPDIIPGYIIQLKVEVPENKRRTSSIKGIAIARMSVLDGSSSAVFLQILTQHLGDQSAGQEESEERMNPYKGS